MRLGWFAWLKVLAWKVDWFIPKCGMPEEALRRVYDILIIILVTSPLPTKLPSFEVELQTGAKSSYSLFRPHLVKEVLLLSGSKQMIYGLTWGGPWWYVYKPVCHFSYRQHPINSKELISSTCHFYDTRAKETQWWKFLSYYCITVGQSCMQFCLIAEIFNLGFHKK